MKKRGVLTLGLAVLGLLVWSSERPAYVVKKPPPPSTHTVNLQLGCPEDPGLIRVWGPCWDDVAAHAIAAWNAAGANFRFHIKSPSQPADPCDFRDGLSTIGWSDNFCGLTRRVGSRTLGFVLPGDQDVVLNSRLTWAAYRGPWLPSQPPDLRRTILHELGHIVGLKHPDEHGQTVVALMNSQYGEIDELQADDINGAIALHGMVAEAGGDQGFLEIPGWGELVSGIGVISGWKCQARGEITVVINDVDRGDSDPVPMAYGNNRLDTLRACQDQDNGFVSIFNWGILGPGEYVATAYDDGVKFDETAFTVGSTDEEFLTGVEAECLVPDFPAPGENGRFIWNEATQHLELEEAGRHVQLPDPPHSTDLTTTFNGTWSAQTTTSRSNFGECRDEVLSGTLFISNGSITGSINRKETVGVVGAMGAVNGHWSSWPLGPQGVFTGSLRGRTGSGDWSTTWCSGTWTAAKQ